MSKGTGVYPVSKFKKGDRFAYTTTGFEGVVLHVRDIAGTVEVRYDSKIKYGSEQTHVLAEAVLTNLSVPQTADLKQALATKAKIEVSDKDTNRLVNQLYHEIGRGEKLLKSAARLLAMVRTGRGDSGRLLTEDQDAQLAGAIDQFLADNG